MSKLYLTALVFIFSLGFSEVNAQQTGCEDPADQDWRFVACVPSPSECYYSCPSLGSYKAEKDSELCPDWGWDQWACYCPDYSED